MVENRNAEWLIVRRTAKLGDLVDEVLFSQLAGVSVATFRKWVANRGVFGISFPIPIFRPEGRKSLWLRSEAEAFVRLYKAKKHTRRKK